MSTALRRNIVIDYATDYELNLFYYTTLNTPIDLSDWSIAFELRERDNYDAPLMTVPVVGDDEGGIHIKLTKADTTLVPNTYYYSLEMTKPNGDTFWLLWGSVLLNGGDRK